MVGIKIRDDLNTDGDGTGEPGATGTLGVSRGQTFIHNGGAFVLLLLAGYGADSRL